ncbi:MAG: hypothetical protein COA94_05060 [Rickettsiales bacterium]|nr:MAG: hypothetical protein COA94_05060 [Rickettsiales bacterium]
MPLLTIITNLGMGGTASTVRETRMRGENIITMPSQNRSLYMPNENRSIIMPPNRRKVDP